jgi:hypothetical protein
MSKVIFYLNFTDDRRTKQHYKNASERESFVLTMHSLARFHCTLNANIRSCERMKTNIIFTLISKEKNQDKK